MENTYLKEFADLAKTCNFQESAENMFVSTPTLSKHIRKMEEELGVSLFDRSTRTVSLSKFGEILLPYAQQITQLTEQYLQDIRNATTIADNQLNIAFLPMLSRFGVLDLLSEYSSSHPSVTMNIMEDHQLEEQLLAQKYDFVFVDSCGPHNPKIEQFVLKVDYQMAVFPKGHPLENASTVSIEQLRGEKFILQCTSDGKPTITAQNFLNCCQQAGFDAEVALVTRYTGTIAHFVEQGKGIGIMCSTECHRHCHRKYSSAVITPAIPFQICVSYLPSRIKSETALQFLSYLKLVAEGKQGEAAG